MVAVGSSTIIYLAEWRLSNARTYDRLLIEPREPKLLPNTTLRLNARLLAPDGTTRPFEFDEQISWSSSDLGVAEFQNENHKLTATGMGATTITASAGALGLSGTATANVVEDFMPEKADSLHVKVAVVYHDPLVDPSTGYPSDAPNAVRMHQRYGWMDPRPMVDDIVRDFRTASEGVLDFQIVEVHEDTMNFSRHVQTGEYITVKGVQNIFGDESWKYDYIAMCNYYDFFNKRQNGEIDEVWVYSFPFGGMAESQMLGKHAFWWNSSPILNVPENFTKLLSVMGLNYERTYDLALHSFGHRMESAMVHATDGLWRRVDSYDAPPDEGEGPLAAAPNHFLIDPDEHGRADAEQDARAVNAAPIAKTADVEDDRTADPTPWEIFAILEKDSPGMANIGNIHYPPNATQDYQYGPPGTVATYADSWDRYPHYLYLSRDVTCAEWGCDQTGYMNWFYGHIPNKKGTFDGLLNNWFHYFVEYDEAVELQNAPIPVGVAVERAAPEAFELRQNFPNPFNPETTIQYRLAKAARVTIEIYDVLGARVETLFDGERAAGTHQITWVPRNVASGVYFCRMIALEAGNPSERFSHTIKTTYLK